VLARNGVLVVRPDSGDPPATVCRVLELLGEAFGSLINAKGFKVLEPHVRVIQGDGIDYKMLGEILSAMKARRWSADNVAFGSGGGLLQKLNRDTLKFAFKCSSIHIAGRDRDVFKQPVTDNGKRSKAGRLKLVRQSGHFATAPESAPGTDELRVVFRDGELIEPTTMEEVRKRADV
jgi:nicotinamide phosphoribosyltransferase